MVKRLFPTPQGYSCIKIRVGGVRGENTEPPSSRGGAEALFVLYRYARFEGIKPGARINQNWYIYHFGGIYHFCNGWDLRGVSGGSRGGPGGGGLVFRGGHRGQGSEISSRGPREFSLAWD